MGAKYNQDDDFVMLPMVEFDAKGFVPRKRTKDDPLPLKERLAKEREELIAKIREEVRAELQASEHEQALAAKNRWLEVLKKETLASDDDGWLSVQPPATSVSVIVGEATCCGERINVSDDHCLIVVQCLETREEKMHIPWQQIQAIKFIRIVSRKSREG